MRGGKYFKVSFVSLSVTDNLLKTIKLPVSILTTSPSTSVRTRSPISGEMSFPNCCRVVRKRFSLLSCRAPQAGGSCWLANEDEEEELGPLL